MTRPRVVGYAKRSSRLKLSPEQHARIFRRAQQEYGSNHGGGSSNQTPEALERFAADAALELVASEPILGALVLDTVRVGVPELAQRVLSTTGWPDHT